MVLMFLGLQVLCCYSPWALSLWTHYTWIQMGAACAHNHPSESHHSCQSVAVRSALCCEGCALRLCRPYQSWTVCLTFTGIYAVNPETNLSVTRGGVLLTWCSLCLLVYPVSLCTFSRVCYMTWKKYCDNKNSISVVICQIHLSVGELVGQLHPILVAAV
jgi:hypothetical protein